MSSPAMCGVWWAVFFWAVNLVVAFVFLFYFAKGRVVTKSYLSDFILRRPLEALVILSGKAGRGCERRLREKMTAVGKIWAISELVLNTALLALFAIPLWRLDQESKKFLTKAKGEVTADDVGQRSKLRAVLLRSAILVSVTLLSTSAQMFLFAKTQGLSLVADCFIKCQCVILTFPDWRTMLCSPCGWRSKRQTESSLVPLCSPSHDEGVG